MPYYANTDYGYEKLRINPRNGGRWDLKNTGQFHKGITVTIVKTKIKFKQRYKNKKIDWLDRRLEDRFGGNKALGVPKKQYEAEFERIIPKIRVEIIIFLRGV